LIHIQNNYEYQRYTYDYTHVDTLFHPSKHLHVGMTSCMMFDKYVYIYIYIKTNLNQIKQ